jgi:hypothetical protein
VDRQTPKPLSIANAGRGRVQPGNARFPTRRLNIVFAFISARGYSIQLGVAIARLTDAQSSVLQRALVLVIVGLFGSALGRAWEVTGIPRRRLPEFTDR